MKFNSEKVQFNLLTWIILFSALGCSLNESSQRITSESFYVDPIEIRRPNTVISVDSTWGRPTEKEITVPICLRGRLNQQPIVDQPFVVDLVGAQIKASTDLNGCIFYGFRARPPANPNSVQFEKMNLSVVGVGAYSGSVEVPLMFNFYDDQNSILDLRVNNPDAIVDNLGSAKRHLSVDEAIFSFQEQEYNLKPSLELDVKRTYNLRFQPKIFENIRVNEYAEPRPLLFGTFELTVVALDQGLNLSNFNSQLSNCDTDCFLASRKLVAHVKDRSGIDESFNLEIPFHRFPDISDKNLVLFVVHPNDLIEEASVFLGQIDLLTANEMKFKLTKMAVSSESLDLLLEKSTLAQNIVNAPKLIMDAGESLNIIKGAEHKESLRGLLGQNQKNLGMSQKVDLCGYFFSGAEYFSCIFDLRSHLKIQFIEASFGQGEKTIRPIIQDQFIVKKSIEEIREIRADHGQTSGSGFEGMVYADAKIHTTSGVNWFGNGVTLQGDVGVKVEGKTYRMWFETISDTERIRQQTGYYKEFLVDQLQFGFTVTTQNCVEVELSKQKKYFYYCDPKEKPKVIKDSFFYFRPRQMNGQHVGLVDINSSLLNFKRAIYGEKSFRNFRHHFEESLVQLYEVPPNYKMGSIADMRAALGANKPPIRQIPALFVRESQFDR